MQSGDSTSILMLTSTLSSTRSSVQQENTSSVKKVAYSNGSLDYWEVRWDNFSANPLNQELSRTLEVIFYPRHKVIHITYESLESI